MIIIFFIFINDILVTEFYRWVFAVIVIVWAGAELWPRGM